MSERFFSFSDKARTIGDCIVLDGDEAHHLVKVMRINIGEEVVIFDGNGREYKVKVDSIARDNVNLRIMAQLAVVPEPLTELTIAISLPKGDRQKWMIEKLTELGCHRVIPLETRRGIAKAEPGVITRLKRQVLEASKQCGRSRLMEIESGMTFSELEKWISAQMSPMSKCFAHPDSPQSVRGIPLEPGPNRIIVAIGPEGGFSDEETDAFQRNNWLPISLGNRILRIETAAVLVCSVLVE